MHTSVLQCYPPHSAASWLLHNPKTCITTVKVSPHCLKFKYSLSLFVLPPRRFYPKTHTNMCTQLSPFVLTPSLCSMLPHKHAHSLPHKHAHSLPQSSCCCRSTPTQICARTLNSHQQTPDHSSSQPCCCANSLSLRPSCSPTSSASPGLATPSVRASLCRVLPSSLATKPSTLSMPSWLSNAA